MKHQILLASPLPEAVERRAKAQFGAVTAGDRQLTVAETVRRAEDHRVSAILTSARLKLTAADITRLPDSVRIVATCSVGYEHIDLAAARARNIWVTNTPDVLTDATADLTMMLMLCACRRAREYDAIMRNGWRQTFGLGDMLGKHMTGCTLGIVGMGRIGRAVAQRARGFEMHVIYHNRTVLPDHLAQGAAYYASLEAMLMEADIVTLHAPGTGVPLLSRHTIECMKPGSVLINAARGSLVDEEALLDALQSGRIGAAGLDTFACEPDFDLRFNALPNVFLTPHAGSATIETRNAMGMRALDNIAAALSGATPADIVT